MSHVAKILTRIRDLDALEKACQSCGLVLHRGQKNYRWYGSWQNDYSAEDAAYRHGVKPEDYGKCEHAISVPGNKQAYEVGLVRDPEDSEAFFLIWDFYAGGHGLQQHLGGPKDCNKLLDQYNKEVVVATAQRNGFSIAEEVDASTGEITLTLNDYT